jgi:hypothetical protein
MLGVSPGPDFPACVLTIDEHVAQMAASNTPTGAVMTGP